MARADRLCRNPTQARCLHREAGKPLAFAATVDTFGCLNFSAKPLPPVQRGRGFVTVYEGDRIVWQGHEEDVPEQYR
jgi:hypothetical protein